VVELDSRRRLSPVRLGRGEPLPPIDVAAERDCRSGLSAAGGELVSLGGATLANAIDSLTRSYYMRSETALRTHGPAGR